MSLSATSTHRFSTAKDDDCHLSGQSVLMLDHSFCDSVLSDIQTKSPLAQLESVASDPTDYDLRKGIDTFSLKPLCRQL